MGFRKALYDVEEKGLDPNLPHKNLGSDGRLKPVLSEPSSPVVREVAEKQTVLVTSVSNYVTSVETTKEQPMEALTSNLHKDLDKSSDDLNELSSASQELSDKKEPKTKGKKVSTSKNGNKKPLQKSPK